MLSIRFQHPVAQWRHRLDSLADQMAFTVNNGVRRIAENAAEKLRQKTPGDTLPQRWTVRRLDRPGGVGYEVLNTDPRAYADVRLSDGRVTNLLEMLEYGTRPHEIRAKKAKALAFFWPAVGANVFVQSVKHPGTRAYGMVRIVATEAAQDVLALLKAANQVLDDLKRGG